jgi:anaerobic magnesium-protoporphyrin IX monomethyl ester cyclase
MEILLVNPPARHKQVGSFAVPPLGLAYIAASLRQAGYRVKIKDALAEGMNFSDLRNFIKEIRPDVLGLSSMTPIIDTTFATIELARPYVSKIIVGGPHVSVWKQEIFRQCSAIDFGVVGEGEQTIVELMQNLEDGVSPISVSGVIGKEGEGPPRSLINNLDAIPFPARDLLPLDKYHYPLSKSKNVTTLFTSRGCPFHCIFCDKSVFGSRWRSRSAANTLLEVDEVVTKFKIKSFIIYDDLFTLNKDRVQEFCEGILKRGYKVDWKCESRVNLVDLETLKLMKRAGCSMIAYGVESGNQHGLDYLKKKIKIEETRRAFAMTHQAGIETMAYFILGIPVESYEEELQTIKFAKEINSSYVQFSILSPLFGTRLFEEAKEKGWYREIDTKNPLDQDLKRPVIMSPNWDSEKLAKIMQRAYFGYYFRPQYIWQQLCKLKSLDQLKNSLKGVITLIQWTIHNILKTKINLRENEMDH